MLMKMKLALVIAGSLLFGGVAAAQSPKADLKADFKAKRMAKKQEMLTQFDTNRDGKLDQAEKTAMHETKVVARFNKLDADGNGVITLAEFKAGKHGKLGKRHQARGRLHGMRGFGPRIKNVK